MTSGSWKGRVQLRFLLLRASGWRNDGYGLFKYPEMGGRSGGDLTIRVHGARATRYHLGLLAICRPHFAPHAMLPCAERQVDERQLP